MLATNQNMVDRRIEKAGGIVNDVMEQAVPQTMESVKNSEMIAWRTMYSSLVERIANCAESTDSVSLIWCDDTNYDQGRRDAYNDMARKVMALIS